MESIATPDNAHGKETYCHCENESIGRYVAFGSRTVLRRHHQEGPFLGVKPTKSGRKRKSSPECRLPVIRFHSGRLPYWRLSINLHGTLRCRRWSRPLHQQRESTEATETSAFGGKAEVEFGRLEVRL